MSKVPSKPDIPKGVSWTKRCPMCKSGKLKNIKKKKFFGLYIVDSFVCDKCGAEFVKFMDRYKLAMIPDKSNPAWKEYGRQSLTPREWKNIAYGGMSDAKQMEEDIDYYLDQLRNGNIPSFDVAENTEIILKRNENVILNMNYVSLQEPRAVRTTTGKYGGPSFRVAKGVYFRLGAFNAQSESHEEIREIDTGALALTNKRLIFLGDKRTVNIDIRKVVSVHPYRDAVEIRREGRERTQYFMGINRTNIKIQVEDRIYKEPLSGIVLMCLIEGLAKQIEK